MAQVRITYDTRKPPVEVITIMKGQNEETKIDIYKYGNRIMFDVHVINDVYEPVLRRKFLLDIDEAEEVANAILNLTEQLKEK